MNLSEQLLEFKKRLYSALNRQVFIRSLLRGSRYRLITERQEIELFQLEKFNEVWNDAYSNIPFYSEWKLKHKLPDNISSLSELTSWPILKKIDLQENKDKLIRKDVKPSGYLKTGGSTGEPLHLPTWEDTETGSSMWLGRAAYGIEPGMKTFLIWGHHHLYGKGFKRQINILKRKLKDWLSNMYRVSAYDLSEEAMGQAFDKYKHFSPEFIIGFSPSVLSFCRINKKRKNECKMHPKAVLCTAGPLSVSEMEEISLFFQAPVCMEYGSVECAVMAYTEPHEEVYKVFWDTHLIQGTKDDVGEVKNIVTRLAPCYVPMIRYDIGDYLEIRHDESLDSIIRIETVKGRPSDIVQLANSTAFSASLIGDCVKQVDGVIANQLHAFRNGICIDVVAMRELSEPDFSLVKQCMLTVVPGLEYSDIVLKQVDSLQKTVGGKTPLVIQHECEMFSNE